ncbi:MAG: SRPBCC family protein [Bacteroidetes bacterium]|nr:SRPBCC family protein [Bacteroidota bacterium]
MHTVQVTRTIHASSDRVWDAFDKFSGIADFHPLVERSPALNGIERGIGAQRECHFYGGGSVKEVVLDSQTGRRQTVEIYEMGPFPLKKAIANIEFAPRGEETDVTFTMNFQAKYGPIGWLMGKTVMKSQFIKTIDGVLKGLDDHLRTGQLIGRKGELVPA